jgi:hypothetical protein
VVAKFGQFGFGGFVKDSWFCFDFVWQPLVMEPWFGNCFGWGHLVDNKV